ncbi:OmpH family outer membrane protein [Aurantiacibacter gangjinensis]|uniref:Uncharacterized protein n=1 Tax=Aurantiacibacter gangjinensis TaxID=502682 RepID=A0A0G9MQY8_9SPHN|nr:OmpH family outer membrane protein [Aurantiacibacter gangjinensis]APE29010.1 Outer membrane protein H precursor [Aurantiacibacter gangjinensis]KLE33117.1 hypothetical protein AAW01_03780 [Aurantiacibacter gangjinensis]
MKTLVKSAALAVLATTAAMPVMTAPAVAQVNGMATADIVAAVIRSQAFQTGYQQVNTQYQTQLTTINQRQQQRQQLVQSFDTNGDGQLDQTEQAVTQDASNTTVQQIQAIDREIAQLQRPIELARLYVLQQVAQQYQPSLQAVISANNIQFVIAPDAVVYNAPAADVTAAVTDQINTRLPAAAITPPADFQPTEALVGLYQQVQQILVLSAMQQQAQQQQAQPAETGR